MYRLSDFAHIVNQKVEIKKDCDFDGCYLIGKPWNHEHPISFIGNVKYIESSLKYNISGVICTTEVAEAIHDKFDGGICISDNPKTTFFEIHNQIGKMNIQSVPTIIDETAIIHDRAIISNENVIVGKNTIICANVIIKEGTVIGSDCIIRENTVIGTPAFYYYGEGDDRKLVESTGGVVIENNVELHTGCVVEKGVMGGNTHIGCNTKLDNQVFIGHDSYVGSNCTLAGQTMLAGGVHIGNDSFAGVCSSFAPNVILGNNTKVSAGSVVTKSVPDGQHVSGNFAIEHSKLVEHIKNLSK